MISLNYDFAILSNWFYKNFIVLNPDKCSFMLCGVKNELQRDLVSNNGTIKISKEEKYWESLLIRNLASARILLVLQKKRIQNSVLNIFRFFIPLDF